MGLEGGRWKSTELKYSKATRQRAYPTLHAVAPSPRRKATNM
jgi:hypothetical protein